MRTGEPHAVIVVRASGLDGQLVTGLKLGGLRLFPDAEDYPTRQTLDARLSQRRSVLAEYLHGDVEDRVKRIHWRTGDVRYVEVVSTTEPRHD